jgi:hypothetical protein
LNLNFVSRTGLQRWREEVSRFIGADAACDTGVPIGYGDLSVRDRRAGAVNDRTADSSESREGLACRWRHNGTEQESESTSYAIVHQDPGFEV